MQSAARAEASRRNGALSLGPVTVEGKARAATNSVRHGLCAKEFVLGDAAEQAAFDALLEDTRFTYRAVTPSQDEVCRHIAIALWRRRVCDNLEAALMDAIAQGLACAEHGGDGLPSLRTLTRYRVRLARDLREARAEMAELKAARAQAFEKRIEIARELKEKRHLHTTMQELGKEPFEALRQEIAPARAPDDTTRTNEPEKPKSTNRRARRKAAAITRKGKPI